MIENSFESLADDALIKISEVAKRWDMAPETVLTLCMENGAAVEAALIDTMCLEFVVFPTDKKGETVAKLKDRYVLEYVLVALPEKYIRDIIFAGKLSIDSFEVDADFGQENESGSFRYYSSATKEKYEITRENLYIRKHKVLEQHLSWSDNGSSKKTKVKEKPKGVKRADKFREILIKFLNQLPKESLTTGSDIYELLLDEKLLRQADPEEYITKVTAKAVIMKDQNSKKNFIGKGSVKKRIDRLLKLEK